jgi:hypothetical protein
MRADVNDRICGEVPHRPTGVCVGSKPKPGSFGDFGFEFCLSTWAAQADRPATSASSPLSCCWIRHFYPVWGMLIL